MNNIKIISFIILSIILLSCKKDKKVELFAEYLKTNYSIKVDKKDFSVFIYEEDNCVSCNAEFKKYLDSATNISNTYIIYKAQYPNKEIFDNWKLKYKDYLLLDRTNYLNIIDIGYSGTGKIILNNNNIIVKTFNPQEIPIEEFIK